MTTVRRKDHITGLPTAPTLLDEQSGAHSECVGLPPIVQPSVVHLREVWRGYVDPNFVTKVPAVVRLMKNIAENSNSELGVYQNCCENTKHSTNRATKIRFASPSPTHHRLTFDKKLPASTSKGPTCIRRSDAELWTSDRAYFWEHKLRIEKENRSSIKYRQQRTLREVLNLIK